MAFAGVPASPGRPLIDFTNELPPPIALTVPPGGHGGPGSIQPQSVKLALEASDQMLAAKERDVNKVQQRAATTQYIELIWSGSLPKLLSCSTLTRFVGLLANMIRTLDMATVTALEDMSS